MGSYAVLSELGVVGLPISVRCAQCNADAAARRDAAPRVLLQARKNNLLFSDADAPVVLGPHWEGCANNCEFYKNPQAYARALQDLFLSLNL